LIVAFAAGNADGSDRQYIFSDAAGDEVPHPVDLKPAQIAKHEAAFDDAPQPVPQGLFRYIAVLDVAEAYDDNIFSTATDRKSDFITEVSPSLRAESNWQAHYLRWQAGGEFARYLHNGDERFDDMNGSAEGRLDLSNDTNLFGGIWFGRDHEERESPDEVHGTEPTRYLDWRSYWGAFHRFDAVSITAGGRFERLNYEDVRSPTGEINNDDRDRTLYTGGGRIGYRIADKLDPFVRGAVDVRRYSHRADDQGSRRSSHGYRLVAGVTVGPFQSVHAEIFAGYMSQNYDDARLRDVRTPGAGSALRWAVTQRTELSLSLDRTIEETTLPMASASVQSSARVGMKHRFADWLSADAALAGASHEFYGIRRDDTWLSSALAATLRLTNNLSLTGEYNRTRVASSADNEGFVRNRLHLSATGRF